LHKGRGERKKQREGRRGKGGERKVDLCFFLLAFPSYQSEEGSFLLLEGKRGLLDVGEKKRSLCRLLGSP